MQGPEIRRAGDDFQLRPFGDRAMPIRTSCSACGAQFALDPSLRGRKVRCRSCGATFVVSEGPPPLPTRDRSYRRDDDDRGDNPYRREGSQNGLILGLCIGGGVFLLLVIGGVVLMILQPWKKDEPPPVAQVPFPFVAPEIQNPPVVVPPIIPNPFNPNPQPNPIPEPNPIPQPVEPADPIARAIQQLRSDDIFSQADACRNLENTAVDAKRRAEVVAAIKGVIDNRRPLIPRKEAVRALATWCTTADVPYLIRLLDDTDGGVQGEAMYALGKKKDPRAADPLAQRLNDFFHRGQAAEALKELGSAAESAVIKQLQNDDHGVRIEAIKILKVIGTVASQAALLELASDDDQGIAQAAREALPPALRPPIWGKRQTITLNVHVANFNAWPAIETKIKALADAPKPKCKSSRSGEYMWVTLAPVNGDPGAFARKITFGTITAVHTDQRLIYVESGQ
jgi:predicted Zn finger-like uncharacterized protein